MFSVLVLEIDEEFLRSVVVRRTGWRKYEVSDCHEIRRWVNPEDPLTLEELAAVTAKIPKFPKELVVVSSQAMLLQIPFEKSQMQKVRFNQLAGLIRKESESYTGFSSDEILFGFERIKSKEKDEKIVNFNVTICRIDYYNTIKNVASDMNFKLKRIYPTEVCFPIACMYSQNYTAQDGEQIFIDIGRTFLRVCTFLKGRLASTRGIEATLMESEEGLFPWETSEEELGDFLENLEYTGAEVIISGAGAKYQQVSEFLSEKLRAQIKTADISMGGQLKASLGCEFASAIGAGLRELNFPYFKSDQIGITDAVPYIKRLGDKIIIIPASILLLLFILFGVHNWFITVETAEAARELEGLTRQRDNINAIIARAEATNNEIAELGKQKDAVVGKMHFLVDRIPEFNNLLYITLAAMKADAPQDLKFVNIELLDTDDQYIIYGESLSTTSIMDLALALQNPEWSLFAKVEEIIREERREPIEQDNGGMALNDEFGGEFAEEEVILTDEFVEEEIVIMDETPSEEVIIGDEVEDETVVTDEPQGEDIFFEDAFIEQTDGLGEAAEEDAPDYRIVIVYRFRIRLVMDRKLVADLPFVENIERARIAAQQVPDEAAQGETQEVTNEVITDEVITDENQRKPEEEIDK